MSVTSDVEVGARPQAPSAPTRWHDLDALRGFAMVLGIALHASLSFFPGFWVVEDVTADNDVYFDEFFYGVHGFRMPLFFLLSGFFTAMLWRRRGLNSLVRHRLRRIALPLAIGMVTVVPAVNWTIEWAIDNGVADYVDESGDIWAAAFLGNERAVEVLLDRGVDVNAPNVGGNGDTPLHVAAYVGDADIAGLLLERGADPNSTAPGGTPIEYAVFVGSEDVAELLVDAGSVDLRAAGTDWQDISFWGVGAEEAAQAEAKFGLESWLTSLHHLWFLWFLLWMIAGFAAVAFMVDRVAPGTTTPGAWSGRIMWALIPGTLVPQLLMGDRGKIAVFGPDTSTGWLPAWHVLAYYAVFFAFGALLYGRPNRSGGVLVETLGRWWIVLLPLSFVIVLPLGLHLTFDTETEWVVVSVVQVAYAWLAIVALMGVFRSFLATQRRGVRYLSDSAYWLYLAHLPLVIVAQSSVREWDYPATVKFLALTVSVTLVLLGSYQLFVRYTPIGTLLNGKRTRPGRQTTRLPLSPTGDERTAYRMTADRTLEDSDGCRTTDRAGGAGGGTGDIERASTAMSGAFPAGSPAIETSAISRSFGDLVAVDGIDLSVSPGELFSLLGPNGAGKTTTIRMLCCLLRPTSGTATIMGHDVRKDPLAVKQVIGVSPQETAVAPNLNALENLRLMAGLHGIDRQRTATRSAELIELMALGDRATDKAKNFSGGMQRRLSIAMALVSDPEVLFLDEPTIGLDPQARRGMWEYIAGLKGETTVVLTTHYLEEADALADRIAVIDAGKVVALGTPTDLKSSVSAGPVTVVEAPGITDEAIAALRLIYPVVRVVDGGVEIGGDGVSVYDVGDCLRPFEIDIRSTYAKRASLDDVFIELTGKELRS